MHELRTSRLLLRQWRDDDLAPYAAMNADPRVMEFFGSTWSKQQSRDHLTRQRALIDADQPALFAVERRLQGDLIGFIGLAVPRFAAPFTPCVEIGWRLVPHAWGQGLATEGATAVLLHGFADHGLDELVSFTSTLNLPSQAVMRRIGMTHDPADDFEHPQLPETDPLRRHVLYRARRDPSEKP